MKIPHTKMYAVVIGCLLILCGTMIGCHSNDDKIKICVPANANFAGDSIAYIYDGDNHLSQLQYYLAGDRTKYLLHPDVVTYTDGKITQYQTTYDHGDGTYSNDLAYVFTYGTGENPTTMTVFANAGIQRTMVYKYDAKNRLVKKSNVFAPNDTINSVRYEYGDNNNVSKIYYVQSFTSKEILGAELLTYDNHQRFYAGSKDLTMIERFVFDDVPSTNNLLTTKVYADLSSTNGAPEDIAYSLTYNSDGYVTSLFSKTNFSTQYSKVNYACR